MNYFKDGWNVSGNLKKSMYITFPNIVWTALLFSAIVVTFKEELAKIGMYFHYGLTEQGAALFLYDIVVIIVVLIGWYIEARLNPFVFRSLNTHVKKIATDGVNEFQNIKNQGPQYVSKKDNPFAGDYIKHTSLNRVVGNTEYYDVIYESNWKNVLENKYELLTRSFGEGVNKGIETFFFQIFVFPFIRLMIWPLSVILAWFGMKPYIQQYRSENISQDINSQSNNIDPKVITVSNDNDLRIVTKSVNIGDTIFLKAGNYNYNSKICNFKDVTFKGEDLNNTTLNLGVGMQAQEFSSLTFENLTLARIEGTEDQPIMGTIAKASKLFIHNCKLINSNNVQPLVYVQEGTDTVFENVTTSRVPDRLAEDIVVLSNAKVKINNSSIQYISSLDNGRFDVTNSVIGIIQGRNNGRANVTNTSIYNSIALANNYLCHL